MVHHTRWDLCDERVREELQATLESLHEQWPNIELPAIHFRHLAEGTHGETDKATRTITLNKKYAADYDLWQSVIAKGEQFQNEQASLRTLSPTHTRAHEHPAQYTLTHEFGHILMHDLMGAWLLPDDPTSDRNRRELVSAVMHAIDPDTFRDVDPAMVPMCWMLGIFGDALANDLTVYACVSPDEMAAEGFAAATVFGPGQSKAADCIVGRLRAAYDLKFGAKAA